MATLRCEDVMTRHPRTCRPDESLLDAIRVMKEMDVGFVPVCEGSQGRLVGMITDRDVASALAVDVAPSSIRIREAMTSDPFVVRPEDHIIRCAQAMEEHQVRRMPVVDHDFRLVGVISTADLARKAQTRPDLEAELPRVIEAISRPR